jgi:mono/diheme cytochrome c family protein
LESARAESVESESPELPIGEPPGSIDQELASQGEDLFTQRGCVACHKIGEGRLVGPDLAGVTDRRSFTWIYSIITNPDSMLRSDSTAQRLLGEYFTPMPNQKVQPEEAQALYEYLRKLNQ